MPSSFKPQMDFRRRQRTCNVRTILSASCWFVNCANSCRSLSGQPHDCWRKISISLTEGFERLWPGYASIFLFSKDFGEWEA